MNLKRYLFEHSYLTGIEYNPIDCSLKLNIDAKITFDHPKAYGNSNLQESFVMIEVLFEGVQYLRLINSPHLLTNPNDDLGSIEQFHLKDFDSVSKGLTMSKENEKQELSLDLSGGNVVKVFSKSKNIKFLNFVSEMITFEIGFEMFSIKEID